jgi:hypothetical protein
VPDSRWSVQDAVWLGVLDLGVALVLAGVMCAVGSIRGWLALGPALAYGGLAAWHFRDVTMLPESGVLFALLALTLTTATYAWSPRIGFASGRHAWSSALVGIAVVILVLSVGYARRDTFRRHLLRHQTSLGTVLYYAFERPMPAVRAALRRGAEPGLEAPPHLQQPPIIAAPVGPHVVFILVDTLRADHVGPYRHGPTLTPNIDAFASGGVVFDDVLSSATWTRASVGSMFTGLYQEQHGAEDRTDALSTSVDTLADRLSARGYESAALVTNYAAVGRDAGFDRGFQQFIELRTKDSPYLRAADVNLQVEAFLKERRPQPERPLFLYVHYLDPHVPYFGFDNPSRRAAGFAYKREVGYFDEQFDDLLALLHRHLGDDVVIVLTSDHGEAFGENATWGHGKSLYPAEAHIPLVVSGPGIVSGRTAARLEGRDLFSLVQHVATRSDPNLLGWAAEHERAARYSSISISTPQPIHRPYLADIAQRRYEDESHVLIWSGYGNTYEVYLRTSDPQLQYDVRATHESVVMELEPYLLLPGRVPITRRAIQMDTQSEQQLRALGYVE